jgi:hypothetical protein
LHPVRAEHPRRSRLSLDRLVRTRHRISMLFNLGSQQFAKTYHYPDVDLISLEQIHGVEFMDRLCFHMAAFEAMPLASVQPEAFDLGAFSRFLTPSFEELWRIVFQKAGAQWRFENHLPHYRGPSFEGRRANRSGGEPVSSRRGSVDALCFSGGGKDSLVAMKLLERGGIPFSSYAYSHPTYGPPEAQHGLIDDLLHQTKTRCRHRMHISDEFATARGVAMERDSGVRTRLCVETPAAVFGALPIALQHGYRYLVIGHERSAESGNLHWNTTGEQINHQWGKSLEAEILLADYIRTELVDLSYFSILKPIHDVVIFNLLRSDLESVPSTHSCNVRKPWCQECAKCAYVWLGYSAYLPEKLVSSMFPRNLLNVPQNVAWFRQLLGLGHHKPFECVGETPEVRLAFEICRRKGLTGQALDMYSNEVPTIEIPALLDRYLTVDAAVPTMPHEIRERVLQQMESGAQAAKKYILSMM